MFTKNAARREQPHNAAPAGSVPSLRRQAARSVLLALSAAVALLTVSAAWFAANSRVQSGGAAVGVRQEERLKLAGEGDRLSPELDYLKENGQNLLTGGEEFTVSSYVDAATGQTVTPAAALTLYDGTAWRLVPDSGAQALQPGAQGRLELYIIPRQAGMTTLTLQLRAAPYRLEKDDQGQSVAREITNDTTLLRLLEGHLLFFRSRDDREGCSGRIAPEQPLTLTLPGGGAFQEDTAYKVTVYWVWPHQLRNYLLTDTALGDLCTAGDTHQELVGFVNGEKDPDTSVLFYNPGPAALPPAGAVEENIAGWRVFYDRADQYIGSRAQFLYVEASVT